jgi:hypothetical protein
MSISRAPTCMRTATDTLLLGHRMVLEGSFSVFLWDPSYLLVKHCLRGNWCRRRGCKIARYPASLFLTLRSYLAFWYDAPTFLPVAG